MREYIDHIRYLYNMNQVLKNAYQNYMITSSGLVFCVRDMYKSVDTGLSYATLPPTSYQHLYGLGVESDEVIMILPIQLYRAVDKKNKIVRVYIEPSGTAKVVRVVTSHKMSINGIMPETFERTADGNLDVMVGIISHRDKLNKRMIEGIMDDINRVSLPNTIYDSHGFLNYPSIELEQNLRILKLTHNGLTAKITSKQIPLNVKSDLYYRFTRSVSAPSTFIAHYILVREHISNHFIYQVMDIDASVL